MRSAVFGAVLVLAACGGGDDSDALTFADTAEFCEIPDGLQDEGETLFVDTIGAEDLGVGDEDTTLACVLLSLQAPDSVLRRIETTRALDGMQEGSWGDYAASWTYHPDRGLALIITQSEAEPD